MPVKFLDIAQTHRSVSGELHAAFERVFQSSAFVLGDSLAKFEQEFANYCGVKYCVGVGNGCDALELSLRAVGVGSGDEVIVPATTFAATWVSVSRVGATPIPVEVDRGTVTMDPQELEGAITERTRAVIPVHLYGQPADMDPIMKTARANGIAVIEDAAQAHGAKYRGHSTGALGDLAAFSFYPGKNLGALGDGGAVVTNDLSVAEKLRVLRNYGSSEKYYHSTIAGNSRLDDLQAEFLRVKLKHLDSWNRRRVAIADRYLSNFSSCGDDSLVLPFEASYSSHSWHLFVVRVQERDKVRAMLSDLGVETLIHYPVPPHKQTAYREMNQLKMEITEEIAATALSLPMGPHLSDDEVNEVSSALIRALK